MTPTTAANIVTRVRNLCKRDASAISDAEIYDYMNAVHWELQRSYDFPFMETTAIVMGGSGTGQSSGANNDDADNGFIWWMSALPLGFKKMVAVWQTGPGDSALIPNSTTTTPKYANRIMNKYHLVPPIDRNDRWFSTEPTWASLFTTALAGSRRKLERREGSVWRTAFASRYARPKNVRMVRRGYWVSDTAPSPRITDPAAVESACGVTIRPRQYLVCDPVDLAQSGGVPLYILNYYRFFGDYGQTSIEAPQVPLDEDPFTMLAPDLLVHGTMERVAQSQQQETVAMYWRQMYKESLGTFLVSQGIRLEAPIGPQPVKE